MKYLEQIGNNTFILAVVIAIIFDTILGVLRAIKEHKFNSSAGIDGAIRKVAMMISIVLLFTFDTITHFNMLGFVPKEYIQLLGITKLGICEFFCLLFVAYEIVSILKNMLLCGLPVPKRIQTLLKKFLSDMTDELEEDNLSKKRQERDLLGSVKTKKEVK